MGFEVKTAVYFELRGKAFRLDVKEGATVDWVNPISVIAKEMPDVTVGEIAETMKSIEGTLK